MFYPQIMKHNLIFTVQCVLEALQGSRPCSSTVGASTTFPVNKHLKRKIQHLFETRPHAQHGLPTFLPYSALYYVVINRLHEISGGDFWGELRGIKGNC